MFAYKLSVSVAEDHRLMVDLPTDFPAGPAEVIVLAVPRAPRKLVTLVGSLGGASAVPPDADPVADALDELRVERAARFGAGEASR